jgi:hypothetical protein
LPGFKITLEVKRGPVDLSIERRAFRRYPLVLPVLFRWTDSVEHYDVGHCGNAGLGGMFIFTAKCPPVGTQVEIELDIPAFALVPHPCRLRCRGRVMRVEGCSQLRGFAVFGQIEQGGNVKEAIEEVADGLYTRQQ